jgi:hypothetical protein
LVAACELDLQVLVNNLQFFLIRKNTPWMETNFFMIYQTSFKYDSLLNLRNYCNDLISKSPDKIFNSLNYSSIPEKILISLIQNDNLKMNGVQVWNHVLKWGLDQNPGLPSDPESFSEGEFSALKNTLQQCIPLIKFDNFTSKEFLNNVFPYREILPEKLFIDLLKIFLDNDRKPIDQPESPEIELEAQIFKTGSTNVNKIPNIKPLLFNETKSTNISSSKITKSQIFNKPKSTNITSINSKIITLEHVRLISKWIDRLDVHASYEFKLIFRGSRNGFKGNKFHGICDYQSSTVTIIKVKGSNEILGGFNPLEWKSDGKYATTNDSFLFSFDKNRGIKNHILSRVKNSKFAISNDSNRGPSFGESDLILRGRNGYDNCACKNKSYEKAIRLVNSKFTVEEYEIFQITKNLD